MAVIKFKGIDPYIAQLNKIEAYSKSYIGLTIYKGAEVVANDVKSAINALPTDNRTTPDGVMKRGPSTLQKKDLADSFGIARARLDGTLHNVKLGFDGYNSIRTDSWPSGQPNNMVARSIESGTSFMRANHFMQKAVYKAKPKCEAVMKQTLENEISKLVK